MFDPILRTYGSAFFITERITRLLRQGIHFFGPSALPVVPSVFTALSTSFTATGLSNCLWVVGKMVQRYGGGADPAVLQAIKDSFENMSLKVGTLLRDTSPTELPDSEFS